MCVVSYLHHHHVPPCERPMTYSTDYSYCSEAMIDPMTGLVIGPCEAVYYDPPQNFDFAYPCAAGGCLISPDCASGTCRLRDLRGRWLCCQCRRGGNVTRWCQHKKRGSPDTFCYHIVCYTCSGDP